MAKTIQKRIDDLEAYRGKLPVMVFEQSWDNADLFYLAKPDRIMSRAEAIDKNALMTKEQAVKKAGNNYTPLFIVYVKDWRGAE